MKNVTMKRVETEVSGSGGTKGLALVHQKDFPTNEQLLSAIPAHLKVRSTPTSLAYAATSLIITSLCFYLGRQIPFTFLAIPVWIVYALVTGTVATGMWVVAHECSHGAFSDNKILQDIIGFVYHSALLVPYFSWQRSHAVHHLRTNHLEEGETHVPTPSNTPAGESALKFLKSLSEDTFGFVNTIQHLVFGWSAYLLFGVSGGPKRGITNHFVPFCTGELSLYPKPEMKLKVFLSDIGILATFYVLYKWAQIEGFLAVFALYIGPYLVTNCWFVAYTWLQHTDVDVPHYSEADWTWAKGAMLTIDRPYPALIDWLHHRIGTTHVAHHVCSSLPHYNAREATEALKKAFPNHYLYDPTPVHKAMWRVACKCVVVRKEGDMWVYTNTTTPSTKVMA